MTVAATRERLLEPGALLLDVRDVVQEFKVGHAGPKGSVVHALSGVSVQVAVKETLGVVGETGCGKSTLARAILQSPPPKSGQVLLNGVDLVSLKGRDLRAARRHVQMVAQDPYSSLDPRWTVAELVEEPLNNFKIFAPAQRRERALELLDLCGLDPSRYGDRHPRQLSGGQCQRVAIARALSISPDLIICDEAVSSLDVSIQGQIINLLETLREELDVAYLFIAHDLAVVEHLSDRIAVMYLGKVVEVGPSETVNSNPLHPYTSALIAAVPDIDSSMVERKVDLLAGKIAGEVPSPISPPSGCRFRTRCPFADERCATEEPVLRELAPNHWAACHYPLLKASA